MKKILLACGSGASSGFIAQSMRQAAKKQSLEVLIKATSDTQILDLLPEVDVLLIGPHLKHKFDEINEEAQKFNVKASLINADQYAMIDGEGILEFAKKLGDIA